MYNFLSFMKIFLPKMTTVIGFLILFPIFMEVSSLLNKRGDFLLVLNFYVSLKFHSLLSLSTSNTSCVIKDSLFTVSFNGLYSSTLPQTPKSSLTL